MVRGRRSHCIILQTVSGFFEKRSRSFLSNSFVTKLNKRIRLAQPRQTYQRSCAPRVALKTRSRGQGQRYTSWGGVYLFPSRIEEDSSQSVTEHLPVFPLLTERLRAVAVEHGVVATAKKRSKHCNTTLH